VIIEMARVRLLGPRAALAPTIEALQDVGVVHLVDTPPRDGFAPRVENATERRRQRHLAHALDNVEAAIAGLAKLGASIVDRGGPAVSEAKAAWRGGRLAAEVEALSRRERALADERDALRAYEPMFAELEDVLAAKRTSIYLLRLHAATGIETLRGALLKAIGPDHELRAHELGNRETVVLLLVPVGRSDDIERYLTTARVERAVLPAGLGTMPLGEALARMRPRLREVERALGAVRDDARAIARRSGGELVAARRCLHDALVAVAAETHAAVSRRAFTLEGWIPARDRDRLHGAVAREVTVEEIARDEWHGEDAPVVLANPKLFAPFEVLTSLLPLPRYGSVDPTPFVAVFFPMLFGVVVGDIGYGLAILAIALVVRRLAPKLAKIAVAVAVYTLAFGVLYGELFGDLGAQLLGMRPLWFDRQEAVLAFLVLAIALGAVHLLLGLVVAAANRWRRNRREAIGRGLTAMMIVLIAVALLALFEQLPAVFVMPAVIAILATFALIVILEGITALFDLMSIVGHVLSYARVMALGMASVMLAVVANRMHGAFGSLALGIAFALVFHVVNFAITLFSPTIHVMRLHYVEFFGTFFEPGGGAYHPLRHWSPEATAT
jgi:V/A-type H+/Na+-transporting ATPase subunit I